MLRSRPFLAGETFSMADVSLYAGLAFAAGAGPPTAPDLGAPTAWRGTVSDLPAVKNHSGQSFLPEDLTRRGA